mgnify:CR=1 FL=1
MRLPQAQGTRSIELKMTPMIDVVFLLLVFFVWTSSFDLPEFDLQASIARPPVGGLESDELNEEIEEFDEIVIQLNQVEGQLIIYMNDEMVSSIDSLTEKLQSVLSLGIQPPVIIDPSDTVTVGNAVKVYDVARQAGSDRVLFAARAD